MPIICTAQALLKEFWDLKVPIDPEYFAEKLGLTVVQEPLGSALATSMPPAKRST